MKPCPICNSSSVKQTYSLTYPVFRCQDCGFLYCPDALFNKDLKSNLDEDHREKALKELRKGNFNTIINSIKNLALEKTKGLEVGSGHGWFLELCRENDIECLGIEPETRFNDHYSTLGLTVINGFFPGNISNNDKFGFIVFNDVFEHLPNPREIMDACNSMIDSKGVLVINLPIREGLVFFFSRLAYRIGVKSYLNRMWQFDFHSPHLSYFSKKNMIELATSHNFLLEESYKLKTINLSEISDRIKQDSKQGFLKRRITFLGILILYPFFNLFPDTYCFVFKKVRN